MPSKRKPDKTKPVYTVGHLQFDFEKALWKENYAAVTKQFQNYKQTIIYKAYNIIDRYFADESIPLSEKVHYGVLMALKDMHVTAMKELKVSPTQVNFFTKIVQDAAKELKDADNVGPHQVAAAIACEITENKRVEHGKVKAGFEKAAMERKLLKDNFVPANYTVEGK